MSAFLKLIRYKNLLMIIIIQVCIRYLVMSPWLNATMGEWGIILQLPTYVFALLVFSTVCIAAAGYIINDYFDYEADNINRPDDMVIRVDMHAKTAMTIHLILNALGIAAGFYVAHKAGVIRLGFIQVVTAAGLWFYSSAFKKQMLIGNFVVALMGAMVPVIVAVFEFPPLLNLFEQIAVANEAYFESHPEMLAAMAGNLRGIMMFVLTTGLLAFLLTLTREIVKDAEDIEGDVVAGAKTLPIIGGLTVTRYVIVFLLIVIMGVLAYIMRDMIGNDNISFGYFTLLFQLPLLYLIYRTLTASERKHYTHISLMCKVIMLAGIGYTVLYNYLFTH